jgi:predicted RNA-binding Zn-ribbon protein involved in translation (DUF1610 family)
MNTATRTTEGTPSSCPICGKRMIVSPSIPLGDATCPHCGALIYPRLQGDNFERDHEKRLAELGVIIETDDEGEVISAELHGPLFTDKTVGKLTSCNGIPIIKICNTGLTSEGIEKLRELLPDSVIKLD